MELEIATTHDVLAELCRRRPHFAFVGLEAGNRVARNVFYACYGRSRGELRRMRLLRSELLTSGGSDSGVDGGRIT